MRARWGPGAWVHRHPTIADGGLAAVLLVVFLASFGVGRSSPGAVFVSVVSLAAITWRRQFPLEVFIISGAAVFAGMNTGGMSPVSPIGALIALYTVSSLCDRRWSIGAGIVSWLVVVSAALLRDRPVSLSLQALVAPLALIAATWLIGDNLRVRRAYVAQLEERAERLETEREAETRRAADSERARIARELHDVVAHHVSVIAVQAGAARMVAESSSTSSGVPQSTSDNMLASIEVTARQALAELRRALGVLRKGEDRPDHTPQPGLDQLDSLIDQVRVAGTPVEMTVSGQVPEALSPGVNLSAYRIVQEALTNVLKHGGGAPARVAMRFTDDGLDLSVTDSGPNIPLAASGGRTPPAQLGGGQGIIGMRERVAIFGGDLQAGPLPGGGYEVRAHIPCDRQGSM
ncbi:MAG TPA: histidine kinase [Acidimicrobiales bacterium]|nr:histidine kinase [Acidimicrobiales bacterium]